MVSPIAIANPTTDDLTSTSAVHRELERAFTHKAVKTRKGPGDQTLTYISGDMAIRRLNRAIVHEGGGTWSFDIQKMHLDDPGCAICEGVLTIEYADGRRESHADVGTFDRRFEQQAKSMMVKGAVRDAIKRCATQVGVALHLVGPDREADLGSIAGFTDDEDDIAAAEYAAAVSAAGGRDTPATSRSTAPRERATAETMPTPNGGIRMSTSNQWSTIDTMARERGYTVTMVNDYLAVTFGHTDRRHATFVEGGFMIDWLKSIPRGNGGAPVAPPAAPSTPAPAAVPPVAGLKPADKFDFSAGRPTLRVPIKPEDLTPARIQEVKEWVMLRDPEGAPGELLNATEQAALWDDYVKEADNADPAVVMDGWRQMFGIARDAVALNGTGDAWRYMRMLESAPTIDIVTGIAAALTAQRIAGPEWDVALTAARNRVSAAHPVDV
jgi:hypothetical protein